MTKTLTARTLITDIGTVEYAVIDLHDDGTIAGISSDVTVKSDTTLTAAFLDVHTHGAAGVDVMSARPDDFERLGRFYAQHGVAHYLATTATTGIDATLCALTGIADAIEAGKARPATARPLGVHLEGPFLSHVRRGVHPAEFLQPPSIGLFERFQVAARGHIKLITLAPELPGALDLIRHLAGSGVRVSLGHSDATAAAALAATAAGASSATHTFNAMRPLAHREPGILGTVLDPAQTLYAELIADGVHVAPPLVRLWWAAMNTAERPRAILVTDSMAATGQPDGHYTLAGLPVTTRKGRALLTEDLAQGTETLAGSLLTMDAAVRNLRTFTGASLALATEAASHTPASMLGLPGLTRLAPGSPANLNRFNAQGRLVGTYIGGQPVT